MAAAAEGKPLTTVANVYSLVSWKGTLNRLFCREAGMSLFHEQSRTMKVKEASGVLPKNSFRHNQQS